MLPLKRLLLPLLLAAASCAQVRDWGSEPAEAEAASNAGGIAPLAGGEVVILHTNDVHGAIRMEDRSPASGEAAEAFGAAAEAFGAAVRATFVRSWNEAAGEERVLVLSAGDVYQGTPEGVESRGRLMVEVMNRIGYEVAALGNHEFDHGVENMADLVRTSRFPWMAENLREVTTISRPGYLAGPKIFEVPVGGEEPLRVGVFGLVTEDLPSVAAWDTGNGLLVLPEVETARRAAAELEHDGADLVVALTHIGFDHDSALVAAVPAVDLVVGGHSHTLIDEVTLGEETAAVRIRRGSDSAWLELPRPVPVVQAGANGHFFGEIRFRWDRRRGRFASFSYRVVPMEASRFPPDPSLSEFLAERLAEVDARMNVPLGTADTDFRRETREEGTASSPLGNFLTDLMRKAAGADIAFQNRGGIRADIEAGPVTKRDLFRVSPFGNTLVSMDLTGAEIRTLLERAAAPQVSSAVFQGGYTPLEVSGLFVWYDPSRVAGDRIVNVSLSDGSPLEDDRTYRVAVNSFLAQGGDRYPEFSAGRSRRDHGRTLLELTSEAFAASGAAGRALAPPVEDRWKRL